MHIDFDIDFSLKQETKKDGQISVKLAKNDEIRFKMLKAKYDKDLNEMARTVLLQLMDKLENIDIKTS